MNKFIPLSSLKDTTGIIELCKNIRNLKNPAEIVKLCESTNKPFPIIRNGYDEWYVMSYKGYLRRKAIITFVKKTF